MLEGVDQHRSGQSANARGNIDEKEISRRASSAPIMTPASHRFSFLSSAVAEIWRGLASETNPHRYVARFGLAPVGNRCNNPMSQVI